MRAFSPGPSLEGLGINSPQAGHMQCESCGSWEGDTLPWLHSCLSCLEPAGTLGMPTVINEEEKK